jgi:hypothetical protein
LPGPLVRRAAPPIAIFYLLAIIERALSYGRSRHSPFDVIFH